MKAADKNRQKLSSSETRATNAKYQSNKKWKINLAAIEDYIEYMTNDE
ncbi:MAG: hypothetical protein ACD_20C00234G0011 [uncultured bacterium]|nr:MAG: hypothetical protein ACD_20C00234G0011 [uncultured bacterium]